MDLTGEGPQPYKTTALVHSSGLAIHAPAFSQAEELGETAWGVITHVASGRSVTVVSPIHARAAVEILASTGCPWRDAMEAVEDWSGQNAAWMRHVIRALSEGDLSGARQLVATHRAAEDAR